MAGVAYKLDNLPLAVAIWKVLHQITQQHVSHAQVLPHALQPHVSRMPLYAHDDASSYMRHYNTSLPYICYKYWGYYPPCHNWHMQSTYYYSLIGLQLVELVVLIWIRLRNQTWSSLCTASFMFVVVNFTISFGDDLCKKSNQIKWRPLYTQLDRRHGTTTNWKGVKNWYIDYVYWWLTNMNNIIIPITDNLQICLLVVHTKMICTSQQIILP